MNADRNNNNGGRGVRLAPSGVGPWGIFDCRFSIGDWTEEGLAGICWRASVGVALRSRADGNRDRSQGKACGTSLWFEQVLNLGEDVGKAGLVGG